MIIRYTAANQTRPGDVREVYITPTYKIRTFDDGTARGRTDRHWILYRRDVASLTDADWYAQPSGDWTREEVTEVRTGTGTQEKEPSDHAD